MAGREPPVGHLPRLPVFVGAQFVYVAIAVGLATIGGWVGLLLLLCLGAAMVAGIIWMV
jgi:hypothetical protein